MITIILFCLATASVSIAFDCEIPPVYVDIHKRAVHGAQVFEYGLFMGLGTGAQNQSMWPSMIRNETTIADINICQNVTIASCQDSTGGLFDPHLSST